jgi:hypothetical protein
VEDEGMGRGRVAAHFFRLGGRGRLEDVRVDTGSVKQAIGTRHIPDHADRPLQRVAKGPPPRGTGIPGQVWLAPATIDHVEGGDRQFRNVGSVQSGIPVSILIEPLVQHWNAMESVLASLSALIRALLLLG